MIRESMHLFSPRPNHWDTMHCLSLSSDGGDQQGGATGAANCANGLGIVFASGTRDRSRFDPEAVAGTDIDFEEGETAAVLLGGPCDGASLLGISKPNSDAAFQT